MLALILVLVAGLAFSFFALQNTQTVSLYFREFAINNVPLYIVTIVSMIIGIALSLIISLAGSISSAVTMFGKDRKIKSSENELHNLEDKIQRLEVENATLRGKKHQPVLK